MINEDKACNNNHFTNYVQEFQPVFCCKQNVTTMCGIEMTYNGR